MEQLNYNLLFRWFVGLEMDDEVWDVTVFTKNRERRIAGEVRQHLLAAVLAEGREKQLLSAEHFTVDGTLIPAWAASRSFQEKSDPPAPGKGSGHGGEVLLRDKVESKTDPEARLYKKATADKSVPSYQRHALMENRNGLAVAAQATCAGTAAERKAAVAMLDEVLGREDPRAPAGEITLGADTPYQDAKFIAALRERGVAPHVSEYSEGRANAAKNALKEAERAVIDEVEMQFLYADGDSYYFMNTANCEQIRLGKEAVGDRAAYMMPEVMLKVAFFEGRPVDVELPATVDQWSKPNPASRGGRPRTSLNPPRSKPAWWFRCRPSSMPVRPFASIPPKASTSSGPTRGSRRPSM
jgi:hypothetical protein